jgi:hypothetical protein
MSLIEPTILPLHIAPPKKKPLLAKNRSRARRGQRGPRTFIYFVQAGDFVKIGQSKEWKQRLRFLQTGMPHEITPILVFADRPVLEKKLHSRFKADRVRGEWFRLSQQIIDYIGKNRARCVLTETTTKLCLPPEQRAAISEWAAAQAPGLSLPDAIAKLVELGLKAKGK